MIGSASEHILPQPAHASETAPQAPRSLKRTPSVDSFLREHGGNLADAPHAAELLRLRNPVLTTVLTGGPCGGKTTLLEGDAAANVPALPAALERRGLHATVVTEAAAEEIRAHGAPLEGPGGMLGFNQRNTARQLAKESAAMKTAIASRKDRAVVVCDRGPPDALAYLSQGETRALLAVLNQQKSVMDPQRYDAVMHLNTAAKGAVSAYRWKESPQNPVDYRPNPPEEARSLDDRLRQVYSSHPHQHVFENRGDFADKRQAVIDTLVHFVNLRQRDVALQDLHTIAPVFNIEGVSAAQVAQQQCLLGKPPLWLAAHVVLDAPLHGERETYDELRARTAHLKLKESGMPGFQHRRAKLAYLSLVGWAVENVHREQGKAPQERAVVTVKIHRTSPLAPVVRGLLAAGYPGSEPAPHPSRPLLDGLFISKYNVEVQFRDAPVAGRELDYDLGRTSFAKSDAVVSLGLVGSLSEDHPTGTVVLTDKFIPMGVDSRTLDWSKVQSAHNLAVNRQADIIALASKRGWAASLASDPAFASPCEEGEASLSEAPAELAFRHVPLAIQMDKLYSPTNKNTRIHLMGSPSPAI